MISVDNINNNINNINSKKTDTDKKHNILKPCTFSLLHSMPPQVTIHTILPLFSIVTPSNRTQIVTGGAVQIEEVKVDKLDTTNYARVRFRMHPFHMN